MIHSPAKIATVVLGSPSLGGSGSVAWQGLVESRTAALDEARAIARDLGRFGEERLRAYADGLTLPEMAARFAGSDERRMATILDSDLNGLARHFQRRGGDA